MQATFKCWLSPALQVATPKDVLCLTRVDNVLTMSIGNDLWLSFIALVSVKISASRSGKEVERVWHSHSNLGRFNPAICHKLLQPGRPKLWVGKPCCLLYNFGNWRRAAATVDSYIQGGEESGGMPIVIPRFPRLRLYFHYSSASQWNHRSWLYVSYDAPANLSKDDEDAWREQYSVNLSEQWYNDDIYTHHPSKRLKDLIRSSIRFVAKVFSQ